MLAGGNAGQGAAAGVSSSGATIGAGNAGQSVDPNPFCSTGITTPACNSTVNMTIHPMYYYNKRIVFVEPTFIYAAYQNASFYNFYKNIAYQIHFIFIISIRKSN